ncbi:MAG TPA: hypothetical protein ENH03_04115 [Candidatus Bathyarchaeota archaeon]|nr:hypothetical protein [Candidatus Bathyarchaeota archaeon]
MFKRAFLTILIWGLILEILCVIHFSSSPWKFEFAYSVFLLAITSIALIFMLKRLRDSFKGMRLPKE